jgi:hypothetical protein
MQKKIFLWIKQSSLPLPNLPNSPNLLNTRQIRRSESQKFAQYSPNSPEQVTKIWRIFGEYSHSPNSLASCHCLIISQQLSCVKTITQKYSYISILYQGNLIQNEIINQLSLIMGNGQNYENQNVENQKELRK